MTEFTGGHASSFECHDGRLIDSGCLVCDAVTSSNSTRAASEQRAENLRAAGFGMGSFFKDQGAGSFGNSFSRAIAIEWPNTSCRRAVRKHIPQVLNDAAEVSPERLRRVAYSGCLDSCSAIIEAMRTTSDTSTRPSWLASAPFWRTIRGSIAVCRAWKRARR